ncbi:MAG: type II CAAX endopeptidase family protein [Acidobacteriota bacterium]
MNFNTVFFDSSDKFRSGWRVIIFLLLWTLCSAVIAAVGYSIVRASLGGQLSRLAEFGLGSSMSLFSTLVSGWLCGRWLEGLPYKALGAAFSKGWLRHFILGSLVGAASLTFAVGIAYVFGNFTLEFNREASFRQIATALTGSLLILSLAAAFEEAFFRGYMFQTLARSGLAWFAIVLTAVFFGAVHLGNPAVSSISTADTVVAGILFGIAYLKTRDLWFPFGIHLMWNWMQGSVFGIEVSGLTELSSVSIFKEIDRGPDWLTGGTYGIEGGIASTAALIITVLFIYYVPLKSADTELDDLTVGNDLKSSVS